MVAAGGRHNTQKDGFEGADAQAAIGVIRARPGESVTDWRLLKGELAYFDLN